MSFQLPHVDFWQEEADSTVGVALANVFVDAPYNRTGFTLVSTHADRVSRIS